MICTDVFNPRITLHLMVSSSFLGTGLGSGNPRRLLHAKRRHQLPHGYGPMVPRIYSAWTWDQPRVRAGDHAYRTLKSTTKPSSTMIHFLARLTIPHMFSDEKEERRFDRPKCPDYQGVCAACGRGGAWLPLSRVGRSTLCFR
jgi:hypothetical protein